jgi:hypothetical protein
LVETQECHLHFITAPAKWSAKSCPLAVALDRAFILAAHFVAGHSTDTKVKVNQSWKNDNFHFSQGPFCVQKAFFISANFLPRDRPIRLTAWITPL